MLGERKDVSSIQCGILSPVVSTCSLAFLYAGRNEEFPCYPRFPEQLSDSFLQLLSELSGSPIPVRVCSACVATRAHVAPQMDDPSFSSVTYRPLANGDPDMYDLNRVL